MRKYFFILSLLIFSTQANSQNNIWGTYVTNDSYFYEKLELLPSGVFHSNLQTGSCIRFSLYDTGIYKIIDDTIVLFPFKRYESRIWKRYYLIGRLNKDSANEFNASFPLNNEIAYIGDTSNSGHFNGYRLNSHQYIGSRYFKKESYFNNGQIESIKTFVDEKNHIITLYHPSGGIRVIQKFYKNKKTGNWIYFDKNGRIEKEEKYRNDKLIKPIFYQS